MLLVSIDLKIHGDRRVEGLYVSSGKIFACSKGDPVYTGIQGLRAQIGHAAVVVGDALGDCGIAGSEQREGHAGGRGAERSIEGMGGYRSHENSPCKRSEAIWLSCSATSVTSCSGEFSMRRSNCVKISSGLRPAARIRKTRSKRSSYSAFP